MSLRPEVYSKINVGHCDCIAYTEMRLAVGVSMKYARKTREKAVGIPHKPYAPDYIKVNIVSGEQLFVVNGLAF